MGDQRLAVETTVTLGMATISDWFESPGNIYLSGSAHTIITIETNFEL